MTQRHPQKMSRSPLDTGCKMHLQTCPCKSLRRKQCTFRHQHPAKGVFQRPGIRVEVMDWGAQGSWR